MSVSLYRRYRPRTFSDVKGQSMAVDVLHKALLRGQTGHAYLFSGPRGCGKTSMARLLAAALNCTEAVEGEPCGKCASCVDIKSGNSLDVVEIDGASNNGVEEIRELKTHVSLASFSSRWKIYIIDEVHMLSISAFNALLKTLEEPPSFVAFILATTEPQKVPATIRSRCQHIPFRRISVEDIAARLAEVARSEGVSYDEEALREIARQSDGALRDALSLMEQGLSLSGGELTAEGVARLLGGGTLGELESWITSLRGGSPSPFLLLEEMFRRGASPQRVVEGIFLLFRNLWVLRQWGPSVLDSLSLPESEKTFLLEEGKKWNADDLGEMMLFCSKLIPQLRAGLRFDVLSGLLSSKAHGMFREKDRPPMKKAEIQQAEAEREEIPARSLPQQKMPVPSSRVEHPKEKNSSPVPLSAEEWGGFEEMLFEKDILLYCALAGTEITLSGRNLSLRFPEDRRYCFEALSSERNTFTLGTRIEEHFGGGVELTLCWMEEKKSCGRGNDLSIPAPAELKGAKEAETRPLPLFRVPESVSGVKEKTPGESGTKDLPPGDESPAAEGTNPPELPFEGLVNEVLKWSSGEVILIKKGGAAEEDAAEDLRGD